MTVENISIDVKTNAGNAARQVRSLSSALAGVRGAGRSVASGGTHKAVSRIGSAAKSSTSAMGKLFNSIKRIAMYRLLRTALKEITKGFQEGLKNAYEFSRGIDGSLAQALDHLTSISGQMKNQMGAAFGELLQTIMPIIEAIVSAITRLMSAISALFAALGGRAQYLSVGESEAAGWDKASGAAKKYKNTILGFDEINRLNDESGGGGGGGDSGQGVWELSDLPDWAMKIKDAIDAGDWRAAGEALADHLNEIIDKWDAYAAGKKLGEKINNAINFAYGFLTRFDFGNAGKKVAEFFNGIFDTVDWELLGRTLVRGITGVFDFAIGFIENLDTGSIATAISNFFKGVLSEATNWLNEHNWSQLGETISQKIHEFITNIEWGNIAVLLSGFLWKAFNSAKNFIDSVNWSQLADDFYNALKEALDNINFGAIARSVFALLGSALAASIQFIASFISDIVDDIAGYFKRFIEDENNDGKFGGAEIIKGFFKGIGEALKNVGIWIWENIVKPFIEAFEHAFGIASPAKEMEEPGRFVGEGILAGIIKPFKDIYNWIKENIFDPFVNGFKKAFGMENGESVTFKNLGEKIIEGLANGFKAAWDSFVENVKSWWESLKNWFSGLSLNLNLKGTTVNENGFSNSAGNFASGGSIENNGTLFVAGEAGPEIVADMGSRTGVMNVDQMEAAVANGNIGVINAIYGMANAIVKAVNEIDPDITLDGQSLANKLYQYNKNATTRYGATMIT